MSARRLTALLALAAVATALGTAGFSGAYFEDSARHPQVLQADQPSNWLLLRDAGATQLPEAASPDVPAGTAPVATGQDAALRLDLGRRANYGLEPDDGRWPQVAGAFAVETPESFPEAGVDQIDVAISSVSPLGPAGQPIGQPVLSLPDFSDPHTRVMMGAGERRVVTLAPDTSGLAARSTYTSTVIVRLELPDGSVMRYHVPVALCTAARAEPCG